MCMCVYVHYIRFMPRLCFLGHLCSLLSQLLLQWPKGFSNWHWGCKIMPRKSRVMKRGHLRHQFQMPTQRRQGFKTDSHSCHRPSPMAHNLLVTPHQEPLDHRATPAIPCCSLTMFSTLEGLAVQQSFHWLCSTRALL